MLVLSQSIIFINIYWVLSQNFGLSQNVIFMNIYWVLGQNLGFKSKHNIYIMSCSRRVVMVARGSM